MPTLNVVPGSGPELQDIANALAKSKKVVVITGAGISTNCGIPDFRSENGLYSLIQAQYEAAANMTPTTDSIIVHPAKRQRINQSCPTSSLQANAIEGRCVLQLPSPHSHSSGMDNVVSSFGDQQALSKSLSEPQPDEQLALEPPKRRQLRSSRSLGLKDTTVRPSLRGIDKKAVIGNSSTTTPQEVPRTRRQLRSSRALGIKDITIQPLFRNLGKQTLAESSSLTDLQAPITQRQLHSSGSSKVTYIASDFGASTIDVQPLPHETPSIVLKGVSNISRRLRSSKLLNTPDAFKGLKSGGPDTQPSANTPSLNKGKSRTSQRRLRSLVSSSITQASTPPKDEIDGALAEDTLSIEVILPGGSLEQPLQSHLQEESCIHVDIGEPLSSQASTNSAATTRSLPNLKGKDLFDAIIWSNPLTTSIFYTFISSLRQKILSEVKETTPTHKFIRVLRDGGRLVRNYTQNIDLLEAREGLCTDLERGPGSRTRFNSKVQKEAQPAKIPGGGPHDRGVEVVHLHGKLDGLRCGLCARYADWDEENRHQATLAGEAPECPWCRETNAHREGRGRRRLAIGRLRPDIVLYGEEHPSAHLVGPIVTHDLSLGPDVLLILGTSLRVHGLKIIVKEFAKAVHGKGGKVIFVNQTKPSESVWGDIIDYWVEWDCDAWVEDLKERRKDIWLPQGTPSERASQEDKQKPIPKNPAATRLDVTNGAHLTLKIMERLGRLSGRLSGINKSVTNKHQELAHAPTREEECRKREESKKRKRTSLPRPDSIRSDEENGAYLVCKIIANLRRLSGSSPSTRMRARVPLASKSTNLPSRRTGTKRVSMTGEKPNRCYLPTPPNSDQETPTLTPGTERIKQLGSIPAILHQPFKDR